MKLTKAEFAAKRAENNGWIVPPTRGLHMPWWPHRMSDSPDGRVTVTAGRFRVGIHADPEPFSSYGWRDAPGLPADLELYFDTHQSNRFAGPKSMDWAADGFVLRGEWVEGRVDWTTGIGRFVLHMEPGHEPAAARLGVLEASIATLMGLVLREGGLLLHAASILVDDKAVVIVGESGRGKTTVCQRMPERFLNEEFAFLAPTGPSGGWEAHCYAQERGPAVERPRVVPLARVCLLSPVRTRTAVVPATAREALTVLHAASLWIAGVPAALQLDAMEGLLNKYGPSWLEHDLSSSPGQLIEALRSQR